MADETVDHVVESCSVLPAGRRSDQDQEGSLEQYTLFVDSYEA